MSPGQTLLGPFFLFVLLTACLSIGPGQTAQATDEPVAIGRMETYTVKPGDTLIEIAYRFGYGFVEVQAANPDINPWEPPPGTKLILPGLSLLPNAPHEGLVINLGEMRIYYYPQPGAIPVSYPIGVGRQGMDTPLGETRIIGKKAGPTWRPTPRMLKEKPELPTEVPPGIDNPLGSHALYLGWPTYAIHGTNRPLGIGRRVSSGCIRMYPEDIPKLFDAVPTGTRVTVIDQPVKIGWMDGELYIEAHPSRQLADEVEIYAKVLSYDVPEGMIAMVMNIAGDHKNEVDWAKVRQILRERRSYPIAVTSINNGEKTPVFKPQPAVALHVHPDHAPLRKPVAHDDPALNQPQSRKAENKDISDKSAPDKGAPDKNNRNKADNAAPSEGANG